VADLHGELATCYIVRLADGTTLRATCPEVGPVPSTTAPPPGSIYLGCDSAATRVWATADGRVISTSARSLAAAAPVPPPLPPPTPSSWRNRHTVCFAALAFLTQLMVMCVAVGWSAGRPSTGIGHMVGLPDTPHDAGMPARSFLKLFTLPSALHLAVSLISTVVNRIGQVIVITISTLRLPATLLHATLASLPAQRFASCRSCMIMLAIATLRSSICIAWACGPGPILTALSYPLGGVISATSCAAILCVTAWTTHAMSTVVPRVIHALIHRLRRARGRVSPLIHPGSPPPWDTFTISIRRKDFIHRPNCEGRFQAHAASATLIW
jgi:hypothetical protein